MKEFHDLDMPGPKKVLLWDRLRKWLNTAKSMCPSEEAEAFRLDALDEEISALEKTLSQDNQLIGFCHNDLQTTSIQSYNTVAYDIANHFCEMAADYHTETPHILDYTKYPGLEECQRFLRIYLSCSGNQPSDAEIEKIIQDVEKFPANEFGRFNPVHIWSQEVAWLPAWLQQHDDGEPTDYEQHIIGLGGGGGETTLELERGLTTGNTADLSSRDEGRYKSCHLFLSGEDNSPASFAPSSRNVVNFHLHFSADRTSQNTPSSPLDTSQAGGIASHNYLTVQQTDASACQEEMDYQFAMGYNVGGKHFPPFTSQQETLDYICPQSVSKDKDAKMNCEEDDGYHMNLWQLQLYLKLLFG
ncbi:hypothetical protein RHMOL_Rhmol07G0083200 [Rhododendron molle]|uniref:Uncharacterized protein n=1 Tax=Rhododendron molle TaxID=49168 RepID=A0ACC0MYF2_RHOML|nr:hypothetical protein RHMOL_Rhmol07G0083200 [Rhododendron molle]